MRKMQMGYLESQKLRPQYCDLQKRPFLVSLYLSLNKNKIEKTEGIKKKKKKGVMKKEEEALVSFVYSKTCHEVNHSEGYDIYRGKNDSPNTRCVCCMKLRGKNNNHYFICTV